MRSTCSCWAAVWILQTFLAIVAGLYTRWFHGWALLAGWATAMLYGAIAAYNVTVPKTATRLVNGEAVTDVLGTRHFGGSLADFPFTDTKVYIALSALTINIIVSVAVTLVLRAGREGSGRGGRDDPGRLLLRQRSC